MGPIPDFATAFAVPPNACSIFSMTAAKPSVLSLSSSTIIPILLLDIILKLQIFENT